MTDIERLLRDDARARIAEEGFTARVMGALPRPVRAAAWVRPTLVLGSALLGSVLAFRLAPGDYHLLAGFADVGKLRLFTPDALMGIGAAAALLVSALILAAEPD